MNNRKTALITGSDGGLGSCFAKIHAKNGGELILVGRNKDKISRQKEELETEYNIIANMIVVDLSQQDAAQIIYSACKENG